MNHVIMDEGSSLHANDMDSNVSYQIHAEAIFFYKLPNQYLPEKFSWLPCTVPFKRKFSFIDEKNYIFFKYYNSYKENVIIYEKY